MGKLIKLVMPILILIFINYPIFSSGTSGGAGGGGPSTISNNGYYYNNDDGPSLGDYLRDQNKTTQKAGDYGFVITTPSGSDKIDISSFQTRDGEVVLLKDDSSVVKFVDSIADDNIDNVETLFDGIIKFENISIHHEALQIQFQH